MNLATRVLRAPILSACRSGHVIRRHRVVYGYYGFTRNPERVDALPADAVTTGPECGSWSLPYGGSGRHARRPEVRP